MKETYNMVKTTSKFHDRIKSFCDPLIRTYGISHFYHAKITASNHFIGINLNREWEEYFFSDKSNLLIWPDKVPSCKVKNGVRLLQETQNKKLDSLLVEAKEKYSLNFSVQFVEKSPRGTDMYGFALNSTSPLQHMALLKDMPLIRLFLKSFQEEFKGLYNQLLANSIHLPTLLGNSFTKAKDSIIDKPSTRDELLKRIGIVLPVSFSNRENELLTYLVKGLTATEIASQMFLSKRTIEHHIERMKFKMNSSSKSDLIQKIRELELIGYFGN